jgi:hypothetical protein
VTVASSTRATLVGGIEADNIGGVILQDLIITSHPTYNYGANDGVGVYSTNTTGGTLSSLRITDLTVSGFPQHGIVVGSFYSTGAHYSDVIISKSTVHDTGDTGIIIYAGQHDLDFHTDIHIVTSLVYNQKYNNGIVMEGVNTGSIEHNLVRDCGSLSVKADGPNGILTYDSSNINIANNEVHHLLTAHSDGNGVVLDRNTRNSVLQNNYVHHNAGAGLYLAQCVTGGLPVLGIQCGGGLYSVDSHYGNAVQYNESDYNGYGIRLWGRIRNATFTQNVVRHRPVSQQLTPPSAAVEIDNNWLSPLTYVSGIWLRDNYFFTSSTAVFAYVDAQASAGVPAGQLMFQNNHYYPSGTFLLLWGNTWYPSLVSCSSATGQN